MAAHFEGTVDARWLVETGEDRKMVLLSNFAFIDSTGFRWEAKTGDIIDGASIPEMVWSQVIGTPYIGDYRRASVIHDVACEKMIKTSRDAHRMFYEAMLADGTPQDRAMMFYLAVRTFGPRWDASTPRPSSRNNKRSFKKQAIDFAKLELALDEVLGNTNS